MVTNKPVTFFAELFEGYTSLSIVGMSKNSGKTTVLNRIIKELEGRVSSLALTSIGRDGEELDVVTATKKPRIYVKRGTLIATARKLVNYCDVTKEILDVTGINSPMGEIIIFRSLSDGFVQIGGPSINSQIALICESFKRLSAEKIIVDGALSRKTLASPSVTEATILCSGASLNRNMNTVVSETVHTSKMLGLEKIADSKAAEILEGRRSEQRLILINEDYSLCIPDAPTAVDGARLLSEALTDQVRYVFVGGAALDSLFDNLLRSGRSLSGLSFVVEDGSKLFIKPDTYKKLLLKSGSGISVLNKTNLIAITINPFSAYGFDFDKLKFRKALEERVQLPVINVLEESL